MLGQKVKQFKKDVNDKRTLHKEVTVGMKIYALNNIQGDLLEMKKETNEKRKA